MLLSLYSDFRDFYDHTFAGSWEKNAIQFCRTSTTNLSRIDAFKKLQAMSLVTPLFGVVPDLGRQMYGQISYLGASTLVSEYDKKMMNVVVYHDMYAHAGEGKELIHLSDALRLYPEKFASQYIPPNFEKKGETLRYLRIGKRQFWLRYQSSNDWRSNVGDVSIMALREDRPLSDAAFIKTVNPLLAIDFVRADRLYAIDLNTSPGIKGTGLENEISASTVYNEIMQWYESKLSTKNAQDEVAMTI